MRHGLEVLQIWLLHALQPGHRLRRPRHTQQVPSSAEFGRRSELERLKLDGNTGYTHGLRSPRCTRGHPEQTGPMSSGRCFAVEKAIHAL